MKFETAIIGIGHPDRGDDSLGPKVIEALKDNSNLNADLIAILGDMTTLLSLFEQYSKIIIVDAIQTGKVNVGHLHCFEDDQIKPMTNYCRTSTHAFDLGQTIEMATALDQCPQHLIIIGLEAQQFEPMTPMSTILENKIPELIHKILLQLPNGDSTDA